MLHAHFESSAVDCDGRITRDWVVTPKDEGMIKEFADIAFHHRVITLVVNTYSLLETGALTVTKLADGSTRLSWYEPTDEGHRRIDATICSDEGCDLDETHYRDHRAEAAGY